MSPMRKTFAGFACSLVLAACGGEGAGEQSATTTETAAGTAATAATPGTSAAPGTTAAPGGADAVTARMQDANGREIGTVTLADGAQGIVVSGSLRGVPPGTHAIHIHTIGRCEPPFESAGDHWNPTNRQHGTENPQGPHLGDMPNVLSAADSSVAVQVGTSGGTLRSTNALLDGDGAAVVLHAGEDDYRTDPSGEAGARIACGVVRGG
jgi:Cu-Zn family superoxide dismutase